MDYILLLLLLANIADCGANWVELSSLQSSDSAVSNKTGEGAANPVQLLITKLFKSYNKEAVLDMPTIIHMDILLLKVKNTVEKEGIFECVIALMVEWYDRRMIWNPADYGNITFLSLTTDQVWLPDIAMTNSAEHLYSISRDSRFMVRVSYDGLFKFVPTGTARTWCDLKLLTFPFDIQQCSLEFESWSLDSTTMTFDGASELLVDSSFASTQFQLCEHRAVTYYHTYNFTGETFTRLRFEFTVKRKSTFYVINLIFPCATLSFIQLLTFLIPSMDTTADRIGFGTTNLLTLVVFQTIVTEEMPKTSDSVTALSRYVIILICMAAVGILESVIVGRLLEKTLYPPPHWVVGFLKHVPVVLRETPAARRLRQFTKQSVNCQYSMPESSLGIHCHYYENDDAVLNLNKQSEIKPSSNSIKNPGLLERPEDIKRRPSYHLAMSAGRLSLAYLLRNKANNHVSGSGQQNSSVNPSLSMVSFQPSLLSGPDSNVNVKSDAPVDDNASYVTRSSSNASYCFPACYSSRQRNYCGCHKLPHYYLRKQAKKTCKEGGGKKHKHKYSCEDFCLHDLYSSDYSGSDNPQAANDLWAEVAFKIDSITLGACISVALFAPMSMFLPLVVVDSEGVCATEP